MSPLSRKTNQNVSMKRELEVIADSEYVKNKANSGIRFVKDLRASLPFKKRKELVTED